MKKIMGIEMEDITIEVIEQIGKETTKKAQSVLNRIDKSETYRIYRCDGIVLLETEYYVTKEEITLVEKITGVRVEEMSRYMDSLGRRVEYLEWKKNGRKVEEAEEVVEEVKEDTKMKKNMSEQEIMNKVQKLLALAGNNPNENEAQAAYAKAQAIIAEYNLDMSKAEGKEVEFIVKECIHSNNEGYRKVLATIIAENFRVKAFMSGNMVNFFGMKQDVEVAVEVFNHAYRYSHNRGIKILREYRKSGRNTHGVANSYWIGFCKGLKDTLDEQCKALMIVTPQEVEDKWKEYSAGFKKGRGGIRNGGNYDCYEQGYREGKEHMRTTKSLNE